MRRIFLLAFATCLFGPVVNHSRAAPQADAAEPAPLPRPVQRRLELWQRPADAGLTARYQLTRKSSLLYEPLTTAGVLTFTPPDRLELRDDGPTGATTRLTGAEMSITVAGEAARTTPTATSAARRWLGEHLLALLTARDPAALRSEATIRNLRGPGTSIEVSPAPGHPALRTIEALRAQLDPNSGEILLLVLAETSGDLVTISLAQHRRAE